MEVFSHISAYLTLKYYLRPGVMLMKKDMIHGSNELIE